MFVRFMSSVTFVLIIISRTDAQHKSSSTSQCNLELVDYGQEINCSHDVKIVPLSGQPLTVYNQFNFVNSNNSFCDVPRIDFSYFNYAIEDVIDLSYRDLYTFAHFAECKGAFNGGCKYQTCVDNKFLHQEYKQYKQDQIEIDVSVSESVNKISCNGYGVQYRLTLTCQRGLMCNWFTPCHDMIIDWNDNILQPIECVGQNACKNVIINAQNVRNVTIKCYGKNACSHIVINANNVGNFELFCEFKRYLWDTKNETTICTNMYIDVEYADSVIIVGKGDSYYRANSLTIGKGDSYYRANSLTIGKGDSYYRANSLTNSTIYGREANKLQVSVFDGQISDNIIIFAQKANFIQIKVYGHKSFIKSSIYAENATEINIQCFGHSSCSELNILVSHANRINISTNATSALANSVIYANESNELKIWSFYGYRTYDNIIIYTQKANSIEINVFTTHAFSNSSIYAQHSNKLNITCSAEDKLYTLQNDDTCLDTNIYLSSNEKSNTLNCGVGGCHKINLYFENDIDVSLFNIIRFGECHLCSIGQSNKWTIYYDDYNSSIIVGSISNDE
eukprot:247750_1